MRTENFASPQRKSILYFIIVGIFSLLVFRLFQMQIIQQQVYDEKSANNSIKAIEQIPLRGIFYDRNGEVVVNNIPAYTLRITPAYYDKKLNSILETVLDVDSGYISKILYSNKIFSKFIPIRIKRGVDFKVISWYEENSENLPGVDYVVEMQRGYPDNVVGSHVFGYTKEISPALLEKDKDYYSPGDYVGYTGIEKSYEKLLRGEKGYKYVLVDSKRKEIGRYKKGKDDKPSVKGKDLVLSIDADVQRAAEQSFGDFSGAAVAMEPSTGEVLALVSKPDYDLNEFSYVTSKDFLAKLYNNPQKPSYNRATMSMKPPGSTFKPMEAIAALDMGVINENTTIFCNGGFTFGRFFKCHGGPHGALTVTHAIEKSCNTFFYNLIYKIGLDRWSEYAHRFGFAEKTGIDIGDESAGLIPDNNYYVKRYGENWPRSIMASLGIGQGEVNVTPIQLAKYVSLIANNGKTYVPHVVKGYIDTKTKKMIPLTFPKVKLDVSQSAIEIVKKGMYLVVQGNGTATGIRMKDIEIAGKTGTAQNPHGKDHAVFICFAPFHDPKIAIAVIVENAGFGATYAAPIAKKMIEAYLKKDELQKDEKDLIPKINTKVLGASFAN